MKYLIEYVIMIGLLIFTVNTSCADITLNENLDGVESEKLTFENFPNNMVNFNESTVQIGSIHLNQDEINKDDFVKYNEDHSVDALPISAETITTENNGSLVTVKQGEYHWIERMENGKKRTEIGIVQGDIVTIQSGRDSKAVTNIGTINSN